MRPWRESPLLRMIRRADLVRTLTFFASVVFLAAGFLVGTKVKVLGTPICFNDIGPLVLESASCASSPHLAGIDDLRSSHGGRSCSDGRCDEAVNPSAQPRLVCGPRPLAGGETEVG
jgi:hypothetical protein